MKLFILVFVLILSTTLSSQIDTTFSELRGMDDSSSATHLFYRKYSYQDLSGGYWRRHNDVYHFDLAAQSDTLIFEDYFYYTSFSLGGPTTNDFEFWDNDPARFISCGAFIEIEPLPFVSRYDSSEISFEFFGEIYNIEISRQNEHLLYFTFHSGMFKSIDGGYTWGIDSAAASPFELVRLSPFNDQIFFSTNGGGLYKSTNSGMSYSLVDSSINWGALNSNLFFDVDSLHIYASMHGYNQSHFLRSTDAGDSWDLLNTSSNQMHLSVDQSQSGRVFLSDGDEIKVSEDYGSTFNAYWQLTNPVVGLYKKPDSDILYAATTKDIYETTPSDTTSIKHLSSITVSIDDHVNPVITKFELHQNYPNPFNPATTIRFDLPKASQVKIEVFNISGQKVATIFEGRKAAGSHAVEFDAGKLASGIYFYRLISEKFTDVKKMILVR